MTYNIKNKLTPHQTNVRKFWRLWLRSYLFARLKRFTFKLSKFTKGVFTWHRGDFRAGARSLRFPLMALHFFTWYHHKMSCRRELPRGEFTFAFSQFSGPDYLGAWDRLEFTPVVVLEREFHPERNFATVFCKRETTTRSGVKSVYRWTGTGSACVMFAILNGTCILSTGSLPSNRPFELVDHVINFR